MKSIVTKLLVTIFAIIVITNLMFVVVTRQMSSNALRKTIDESMFNLASSTAAEIRNINEAEFKLLKSLGQLDEIRNPDIDLRVKYDMITKISKSNSEYIGMAIYDNTGTGWTTTAKYQNLADREYLAESLKNKPYVMKPNWSPVNGQVSTFYAMPFYDYANKMEGIMVSVINGIHLSEIVSNLTVGKNSHPYVVDMVTGDYVASSNIDDIKETKNISINTSPEFQDIISNIKSGKTGSNVYLDVETNEKYICVYQPVGGNCNWAIVCAAPEDDFFGDLYTMLKVLTVVFILSTIIAVLLVGILIFISIKPLKTVDKAINTIATGHADLTQRIKITSSDEVGSVVKGFNLFTEKLQTIIAEIKQSKTDLYNAGEDLEAGTSDTSSSITQIISNIDNVNKQIFNQTSNVNETAGAVNEIASNIESLERMIETQSSSVTQASAAVEQMIGNINAVNQSVTKMAESFESLKDDATSGSKKQLDVNERIEQIEEQSLMLQEANQAIATIAAQTNLLAMNAAIEAAHAGEAGKGFSVVADEIRKLSETSTGQSKTIGDQLNKIKNSIESVVTASAESNATFLSVSSKINDTDEIVRQIKGAMDEQTEGSKQINEALKSMNDSTVEVRTAAAEMSEGNKTILQEVKELQESTNVMKESVAEMEIGAKKINETGLTLSDISTKMKSSIDKMGNQIDQFKV